MDRSERAIPSQTHAPAPSPGVDPHPLAQLVEAQAAFQLSQLKAVLEWQRVLARTSQDAWDHWACRFAGGVPIDG